MRIEPRSTQRAQSPETDPRRPSAISVPSAIQSGLQSEIRNPKSEIALTVIGVGNLLMGDDGVASRLVALLAADPAALSGGRIEYLDGGVGGLRLINWIEQARRLLLVDAARFGGRPGDGRLLRLNPARAKPGTVGSGTWATPGPAGLPPAASAPFSLHQTDLAGLLQLAGQFFRRPPTWLLAVQVGRVDRADRLSPALDGAMPKLAETVKRLALRLASVEV